MMFCCHAHPKVNPFSVGGNSNRGECMGWREGGREERRCWFSNATVEWGRRVGWWSVGACLVCLLAW